jgi:hypothetical protein
MKYQRAFSVKSFSDTSNVLAYVLAWSRRPALMRKVVVASSAVKAVLGEAGAGRIRGIGSGRFPEIYNGTLKVSTLPVPIYSI